MGASWGKRAVDEHKLPRRFCNWFPAQKNRRGHSQWGTALTSACSAGLRKTVQKEPICRSATRRNRFDSHFCYDCVHIQRLYASIINGLLIDGLQSAQCGTFCSDCVLESLQTLKEILAENNYEFGNPTRSG
jgi:hypothetical protein